MTRKVLTDVPQVWTEVVRPEVGAVNFQTGMGGLLQTLVFGFGGARLHLDRLEILRPQLPPDTDKFTIRGRSFSTSLLLCVTVYFTYIHTTHA
jgi:hypothetical protein